MKVDIISDTHLEFTGAMYKPSNPNNSDVLIMAGDITLVKLFEIEKSQIHFFEKCCELYKNVIYISGNHESYKFDFLKIPSEIKKHLGHIKNFHVLNNSFIKIDDVMFFGGTMWSNIGDDDPMAKMTLQSGMNDFYLITKGKNKFTPENAIEEFNSFKKFLTWELMHHTKEKCVVITHHAPSFRSVAECYKHDYYMNCGYASDLGQFILNRPQIKYWIHGHMHIPVDYMIGNTRILSNPRGYVGVEREIDKYDPYYPKTFEI